MVDTFVGRRCSTIVGEDFVGRVCVLGSGNGEKPHPGLWFLPVWYGGIPDSMSLLMCCWCRLESPLVVSLVCVCGWVNSWFSLRLVPLSIWFYFLGLLKSA